MIPNPENQVVASTLAALFERDFADQASESPVDLATWEQTLLGPALSFARRPSKRFRARLTENFWFLFGGDPTKIPTELPNLIELIHAGSLIVDDIQDGSQTRRGEPSLHNIIGTGPAINTGNWLYFLGLSLIPQLRLSPAVTARAFQEVTSVMLRCHQGQALDLGVRVFELPRSQITTTVAEITSLKSGALAELCGVLPGLATGAQDTKLGAARDFCRHLGVGLQMLDDIGSIRSRRDKGLEDLQLARPTWAWAWLAEVASDVDFVRASRLARDVHAGADTGELFDLLDRSSSLGASRAGAHLERARQRLDAEFASSPAHTAIASEIDRLERSYG